MDGDGIDTICFLGLVLSGPFAIEYTGVRRTEVGGE